jgi:hypothetical protein
MANEEESVAERVVVTCDECGNAPADTVGITAKGKTHSKDLCGTHLAALLENSRAPRRGRPRKAESSAAAVVAPVRRAPGRPRKAESTAALPAVTPKRRGRPPKNVAASTGSANASLTPATEATRPRRKITDPVVLEKLRANMAKARAARAKKGIGG